MHFFFLFYVLTGILVLLSKLFKSLTAEVAASSYSKGPSTEGNRRMLVSFKPR